MAITTVIANVGFESGDTGWDKGPSVVIGTSATSGLDGKQPRSGSYLAGSHSNSSDYDTYIWNQNKAAVVPGQSITASCYVSGSGHDGNAAAVQLQWQDSDGNQLSISKGNESPWSSPGTWSKSTVVATAPTGAAYVRIGAFLRVRENGGSWVDDFEWNYRNDRTITLQSPINNAHYLENANVRLAVDIGGTTPAVVKVDYYDDTDIIVTVTSGDYSSNISTLAVGDHPISAVATFVDGTTLTTSTATITVEASPEAPEEPPPQPPDPPDPPDPPTPESPPELPKREFKASNSYTYLSTENFYGLSSSMPSTAKVVGVQVEIDYSLTLLVRSKNVGSSAADSNANVIFDITDGGVAQIVLMTKDGTTYQTVGAPIVEPVPIELGDFTRKEESTSEGKKWTVLVGGPQTLTIGADDAFFNTDPMAVQDFINAAIGFKFYPVLTSLPSYADSGDACIRFIINSYRLRVYFDAGSVEYYFASADKTQIIKGSLVNSYVFNGNFKTGDADGVLELQPTLEVMDGEQTWIGDDWTIHSGYPPTDDNQIGTVKNRPVDDGVGQSYNGLPTQQDIVENRSRYEMITTNFYGDSALDSIYGVTGVSRAFAYNGRFFHYIFTQKDPLLDKPRHVAHHHGHLALGFDNGRVDISVVGKPYNFSGFEGASSWAIGDPVTGLLPLSGTLLGIFCKKSVWGISGTTLDNFATQVIAPRIGAIEYTITDMGFPVYANAYGIYTLSQTSEYGDYLGTPMSQDVSPWLRPRLLRKYTSNKEVVTAWPVRSKNQYRLGFADGYVLSMTLNAGSQSAPTFSFQKYFVDTEDVEDIYLQDSLIPAAISSGLDDTGEERIHAAPIVNVERPVLDVPDPPTGDEVLAFYNASGDGGGNGVFRIYHNSDGIADRILNLEISDAFGGATAVTITGLLADPAAETAAPGDPLPNVVYDDVDIALAVEDSSRWFAFNSGFDSETWYWARVDVDGTIYYGAIYVGTGV